MVVQKKDFEDLTPKERKAITGAEKIIDSLLENKYKGQKITIPMTKFSKNLSKRSLVVLFKKYKKAGWKIKRKSKHAIGPRNAYFLVIS